MDERFTQIIIGGKTYQMLLTTKAVKEIAIRNGGLDKLGNVLVSSEKFEDSLSQMTWLLTLLIDQGAKAHNLMFPEEKTSSLTEEELDVLTTPSELASFRGAITECLEKGAKRNVPEDDESKNQKAG